MRAIAVAAVAVTSAGVVPTASTLSTGWSKLNAHWPPEFGNRTDQPCSTP